MQILDHMTVKCQITIFRNNNRGLQNLIFMQWHQPAPTSTTMPVVRRAAKTARLALLTTHRAGTLRLWKSMRATCCLSSSGVHAGSHTSTGRASESMRSSSVYRFRSSKPYVLWQCKNRSIVESGQSTGMTEKKGNWIATNGVNFNEQIGSEYAIAWSKQSQESRVNVKEKCHTMSHKQGMIEMIRNHAGK